MISEPSSENREKWQCIVFDLMEDLSFLERKSNRFYTELGEDVTDQIIQIVEQMASLPLTSSIQYDDKINKASPAVPLSF